jgi:putative nucleotidyltransferase with HDIG domain
MIPSMDTCFELMDHYQMLENIKIHSVLVARVAHLIATGLLDAGVTISVKKTTAAALLHDIGKTSCLNSDKDHAKIGKKICIENSLDEIADIVGQHVRLRNYNLDETCSETEIVYYADKRVNHDKIVPLKERLSYILARYGNNQKKIIHAIKMNFDLCKEVEKKLFRKLKFDPESVPYLARDENVEI